MNASVLIIYTGGTIGMKEDPTDGTLKPFDFSQILAEVPELTKFGVKLDAYTFSPLIDSSDVEPGMWVSLAETIRDRYEDYDGFVILHGTDTMAYSASTLSFMLEGLTKPVIFTGSQLPIGVPRTDGKENFISAVEIAAAKDEKGHARVPEVAIYFDSRQTRCFRSCPRCRWNREVRQQTRTLLGSQQIHNRFLRRHREVQQLRGIYCRSSADSYECTWGEI